MMRLVQLLDEHGTRRVALSSTSTGSLQLLEGAERVYDLALLAIDTATPLKTVVQRHLSDTCLDYDHVIQEQRLLPPVDHVDPARCTVSLTGLTHLGSARARDAMHVETMPGAMTDSMRMFQLGILGGKPAPGQIGAQPEWAYKGDGRCVVEPEHPFAMPGFTESFGEEAEIVGVYIIDAGGTPWRVGFALGNDCTDHMLEQRNYLYLAHAKLRACAIGPELLLGELPASVQGEVRIARGDKIIWSSSFASGEDAMCHSVANLEHHLFKYGLFRRPGDIHVHFFGADTISASVGIQVQDGDRFEVEVPLFGRPLRNRLVVMHDQALVQVRAL